MIIAGYRTKFSKHCLVLTIVCFLSKSVFCDWPHWRGPARNGVAAANAKPPTEWSETKNIRWKVKLPGLGHSTPICVGEFMVLTTAVPFGPKLPPKMSGAPGAHDNLPVSQEHRFEVLAINRDNGAIAWRTKLAEALPHEGAHHTASLASASPTSDGKLIIVSFGSFGLFCLDTKGEIRWRKQLGKMQTKHGHGEGSSPLLLGDAVVVNWDHEEQSFIAAFDKTSGDELWRKSRDEVTSWSSPVGAKVDGRWQVIVSGTDRVRGYDLTNGDVIWECGGLSANIVASPVVDDGIAFVGSSYEKRSIMAIRLEGAEGDVTGSKHVLWQSDDRTPYVPSPLLYKGQLYFLRHYQGILTRVAAKTGIEDVGPFRLGALRDIYASPVAANNRIYFTDLYGVTQVLSADEIPRMVAINRLEESFSASLAIIENEIYLRGREYLYCVAAE